MQLRNVALKNFSKDQRVELYSAFFISSGQGTCQIDGGLYSFKSPCLIFVTPFQSLRIAMQGTAARAQVLEFHGDFYCIEFHKPEVACNGLLFNNVYLSPILALGKADVKRVKDLFIQIASELKLKTQDHSILTSYLQLFLALTSRIKRKDLQQGPLLTRRDEQMEKFKSLIDEHFLTKRSPAEYANLLNMTANALTKKSARYFAKSPSQLIQERVVLEAKKKLHLTYESVKEIAFSLNFEDEHYFSRFFKKAVGVSPQVFRQKNGISIVADLST